MDRVSLDLGCTLFVPISPTQYESFDWVIRRNVAKGEYIIWLTENQYPFSYEFIKCLHEGIHCHVFNFENTDHAMLFKLRFGGITKHVQSRSPSSE